MKSMALRLSMSSFVSKSSCEMEKAVIDHNVDPRSLTGWQTSTLLYVADTSENSFPLDKQVKKLRNKVGGDKIYFIGVFDLCKSTQSYFCESTSLRA